jgi:uncharacterized membrane protein YgcG
LKPKGVLTVFAWLRKLLGFSEKDEAKIPASDEPFDYPKIEHRPYQPSPSLKPLIYQPRPPATRATAKRRQEAEDECRRRNASDDYDYTTPFVISSASNSYSSGSDTSSYSSHSSCGASSDSGSSSCGGGGE